MLLIKMVKKKIVHPLEAHSSMPICDLLCCHLWLSPTIWKSLGLLAVFLRFLEGTLHGVYPFPPHPSLSQGAQSMKAVYPGKTG